MNFKFVDIGTSDFDIRAREICSGEKILLVEPLFYYLRNLPDGEGIFKSNFAVSDECGFGKMYYVKSEIIKEYNLPDWFRGCNSLNYKHPTVVRILNKLKKPETLISAEEVRILSFRKLIDIYGISSIDSLKIDTEGHDFVILNDVYQSILNGFSIREIQFEYIEEFDGVKDPFNCIPALKKHMELFDKIGFNKQIYEGWKYIMTNNSLIKNTDIKRK